MTSREHRQPLVQRPWLVLLLVAAAVPLICFIPATLLQPAALAQQPPSFERTIRLVAVGDIMAHQPQLQSAYDPVRKQYDFTPVFSALKAKISTADLAIGNLETTLATKGRYTGYPRFRAPAELARDLRATGFDVLVTANNHSLDYGAKGVTRTLAVLKQQGVLAIGTASSADAAGPLLVERNGIRLGIVAYATSLNGLSLPKGRDYLVRLYAPETVRSDIARAKAAGADLIVCYIHFGGEYLRYPDASQYRIADDLLKAGVDLLLGSHPHVVQPEHRPIDSGRYAIYSLGNFVSNQRAGFTDVGLLLDIEITKHFPEGVTEVRKVTPTPTYVQISKQSGRSHYQVLPLAQVDAPVSKDYKSKLTYNRNSLYYDLLGHLRGGVWRPPVPQPTLVAEHAVEAKK